MIQKRPDSPATPSPSSPLPRYEPFATLETQSEVALDPSRHAIGAVIRPVSSISTREVSADYERLDSEMLPDQQPELLLPPLGDFAQASADSSSQDELFFPFMTEEEIEETPALPSSAVQAPVTAPAMPAPVTQPVMPPEGAPALQMELPTEPPALAEPALTPAVDDAVFTPFAFEPPTDLPPAAEIFEELPPQEPAPPASPNSAKEVEPLPKLPVIEAENDEPAPADSPKYSGMEMRQSVLPAQTPAAEIPPAETASEVLPSPPKKKATKPKSVPVKAKSLAQQPLDEKTAEATRVDEPTFVPEAQATSVRSGNLSRQTQRILSKVPSGIDAPPKQTVEKTEIRRYDPEIEGILSAEEGAEEESVARHESMGVKIEVRQPLLDVNVELQNAYEALMAGQPQVAIHIYKEILKQNSANQDALFGIATTFHRTGEWELARPFYGKLLNLNPSHRDGLTNFLTLVAQESPEDAINQLEDLSSRNPHFSPIPAQLGILYDKIGFEDKAIDSLIRAVRMDPSNIAYKYNLAVLYDKYGKFRDATVLYNELLAAGRSGLPLPADASDIQRRVVFINDKERRG